MRCGVHERTRHRDRLSGAAEAAHYNLVENIPLFAIAVMAGELRGIHTVVTAACAMVFF